MIETSKIYRFINLNIFPDYILSGSTWHIKYLSILTFSFYFCFVFCHIEKMLVYNYFTYLNKRTTNKFNCLFNVKCFSKANDWIHFFKYAYSSTVGLYIIFIIIIYSFTSLPHQRQESEWQQVSSSLIDSSQYSANLNNAVVWMIAILPFVSKSSSPSTNRLMTVPRAQITVGITITFKSHSFFTSLALVKVLIFLFTIIQFYSAWTSKSTIQQVPFFFLIITKSGRLA